ncbi:unnamed protein product [Triticum turgidum subsp. durum]|uniref:Uncharacterized protein n=1 Tax=Triticum turgidum subsp. durum TaxID=4567 RepID=A0A9R1PQ19_TRITD|nr:unnamed protein product [Triticum turgidum subsp. durum]
MTMLMGRLTGVALELALAALLVLFLPPYYVYRLTASFLGSVFPDSVSGKVVLITGASSGIGEHLAYEYAKRGANLALVARREASLREVCKFEEVEDVNYFRTLMASKAAALNFYDTLRMELGGEVRITEIVPGVVESEITKGKMLTKEGEMKV